MEKLKYEKFYKTEKTEKTEKKNWKNWNNWKTEKTKPIFCWKLLHFMWENKENVGFSFRNFLFHALTFEIGRKRPQRERWGELRGVRGERGGRGGGRGREEGGERGGEREGRREGGREGESERERERELREREREWESKRGVRGSGGKRKRKGRERERKRGREERGREWWGEVRWRTTCWWPGKCPHVSNRHTLRNHPWPLSRELAASFKFNVYSSRPQQRPRWIQVTFMLLSSRSFRSGQNYEYTAARRWTQKMHADSQNAWNDSEKEARLTMAVRPTPTTTTSSSPKCPWPSPSRPVFHHNNNESFIPCLKKSVRSRSRLKTCSQAHVLSHQCQNPRSSSPALMAYMRAAVPDMAPVSRMFTSLFFITSIPEPLGRTRHWNTFKTVHRLVLPRTNTWFFQCTR